jgi:type I restriction enzyme S subunit
MSDLPPGWSTTELASICTSITDGDHQPPPQAEDGIPFLVIGNVRDGEVNFTGCRHVPKVYFDALAETRKPRRGDVLFTLVGSYGIPVLVRDNSPFCVQRHIGILRPSDEISSKYLALALSDRAVYEQATNFATGTAQMTVPLSGLRRISIPIPPRREQERIVAAIDEQFTRVHAGVAAMRRVLQNVKRMRAAVIQAATTGMSSWDGANSWQRVPLGDVLAEIHAGKSFKCEERPARPDEWGVVKVSSMTWGQFREQENKTVLPSHTIDERMEIRPGDLLVSRANTVNYVGAVVHVQACRPRLLLSDKSLRLVPTADVLPEWLVIALRSHDARRYIERVATGTSDSMRNISQPKLKALEVPIPSVKLQRKLIAEVERKMSLVDQLEYTLVSRQGSASRLQMAILARAFTGHLVPQAPDDEPASIFLERFAREQLNSGGHQSRACYTRRVRIKT